MNGMFLMQLGQHLLPTATLLAGRTFSAAETKWFSEHFSEGAPGLKEYLASERAKTLLTLWWDDYREFLEKGE